MRWLNNGVVSVIDDIKWLEETIQDTDTYFSSCSEALQKELDEQKEVFLLALTALRPVSRERVEKVWPGCEKCQNQANWPSWIEKGFVYCPKCGTPLTSWAWEKQVERLEALKDD